MSLNFQEFERASRDVVRSIGYHVHQGKRLIHDKGVDILGLHQRLFSWVDDRQEPYRFVGECKHWENPIGAAQVIRANEFKPSRITGRR